MTTFHFVSNFVTQVGDEEPLPGLETVTGPLTQVQRIIIVAAARNYIAHYQLCNQANGTDKLYTEVRGCNLIGVLVLYICLHSVC